jgi:calcineurin-like phosphoesterase family protein
MADIWFIADTHFGSHKLATRGFDNPESVRPVFDSAEEHDLWLMDTWNSRVKKRDIVWVLGDLAVTANRMKSVFPRLLGIKHLVLGNHDKFSAEAYREAGFRHKIGAAIRLDEFILTHVPVHPSQLEYRWTGNIHGHIHQPGKYPDINIKNGYMNVNVCVLGGPVNYETLKTWWAATREDHGRKG